MMIVCFRTALVSNLWSHIQSADMLVVYLQASAKCLAIHMNALPMHKAPTAQRCQLGVAFSSYWQASSAVEVDFFAVKVIGKLAAAPDGTRKIIVDDAGPDAGLGHADIVALPDALPGFEGDGLWFGVTAYPVGTYLHPTAIQIATFASVVRGLGITSANFISGL